jgi:hypothetical protein
MNYVTFQKPEFSSSSQTTASTTPRKRGLTAQWLTVDGKLVRNWIIAEERPNSLLTFLRVGIESSKR